jgi:prepilin-type N-terminal cleavage/methylation domain-containing protein/prepilin-type processing-associated H-X9-DG protein
MILSRRPRERAFTLVELLVVIGIIALLIGILLPVMGRVRAQGRTLACAANQRSILQALFIYAAESKGSLPYGRIRQIQSLQTGTGSSSDNNVNDPTTNSVYDWASYANSRMKKVPSGESRIPGDLTYRYHDAFKCPEGLTRDQFRNVIHYAQNSVAMPDIPGLEVPEENHPDVISPAKLTQLFPDNALIWDTPRWLDGNWQYVEVSPGFYRSFIDYGAFQHPFEPEYRYRRKDGDDFAGTPGYQLIDSIRQAGTPTSAGGGNQDDTLNNGFVYWRNIGTVRWRHNGDTAANVGFADGSVRTLKWSPKKVEYMATPPWPHFLGGFPSVESEFKRYMIRIKFPSNRKPSYS